jgi:hypothetical protein
LRPRGIFTLTFCALSAAAVWGQPTITEYPLPTASSNPAGIVKGADGNIWFTETAANKIGKITSGGFVTEYVVPTASSLPAGITAGLDGNIWFTEYNGNKIGRITPSGTVTDKPTKAAAYATEHNLWYPNEVRGNDYFTHRPAANIDFGNPEARRWFWEHLEPAFRAGMTGWWSDEADRDGENLFNNFQFLNMGRSLYDGQRSISTERVWSINRNYYAGALRYGYAEWSGDINTGFQSMAYQRKRMIATLNLGEPEWSMDTGGYNGHPTPENYARWMEFGAFVPFSPYMAAVTRSGSHGCTGP